MGSVTRMRPLKAVADMYDCCLGRPPLFLRRAFQKQVKEVISGEEGTYTWPMVFKVLGVPCPSKAVLLAKLEQAVMNSERKGYHEKGMDFSRLHRSGVSKILLKGESYSAPPNMKKIRMHERWRFGEDVIYLDASCIAYDFGGVVLEEPVDYQNRTAFRIEKKKRFASFGRGAIRHSGDEMNAEDHTGEHTIDVDMAMLPHYVAALYFTVSSWTTRSGILCSRRCTSWATMMLSCVRTSSNSEILATTLLLSCARSSAKLREIPSGK